ncbi:3-oxoacyl-ACP synthase [Fusibacter sp. 3D3]|uniref:3-oxoacyl-ACP synthase n=1 Tax=Fusibacter sp. 3D3 TaxID=1048380 RepID=UPI000853BA2B|nr:3-oxoacyl-ACP synthase [Fusibacter sp. 3D3]GAU79280.1 3-oxoacyl-(acyl carrier protein) synthase [Fusibacter sp. 3D3]
MSGKSAVCGMVGYGLYIPEERISAKGLEKISGIPEHIIIDKIGIKNKVVGGAEDHCVSMAVKSAFDCLRRTQTNPEDIDLIIFNGEEYKEFICWTAAIKVKKEIGATRAWGFDISYRCSATVLAIKLAKDMMTANESIKTVMITGANTIAYLVDPTDFKSSFMLPLTVGACSILLKKDYPENQIFETYIKDEAVFADDVVARHNGSADPRFPNKMDAMNLWKIEMPNYDAFKENMRKKAIPAFLEVATHAMALSQIMPSDVDYVAMVHVKREAHKYILNTLGFDLDQSNYLDEYGHVGHVDNVLSLELGLKNKQIQEGSHILMLTGGLGYSFAALVMKWGKN